MPARIIETEFKLNISLEEWRQLAAAIAPSFTQVSGLLWKIWALNEERREVQGVYLFESEEAAADFLRSPMVTQLRTGSFLRDLTIRQFGVMSEVTAITRGPVPGPAPQTVAPPAA